MNKVINKLTKMNKIINIYVQKDPKNVQKIKNNN